MKKETLPKRSLKDKLVRIKQLREEGKAPWEHWIQKKDLIIDCISDLHGYFPKLEGGDMLIIAGDLTARDMPYQHEEFNVWCGKQKYKEIIVVAGNHDGFIQDPETNEVYQNSDEFCNFTYLQDSGCERFGLKIWGSPWTPKYFDWHFMLPRGSYELEKKWNDIPDTVDILITHGPPHGILDEPYYPRKTEKAGCELLANAYPRIKPKLHVFGHIHGSYGQIKKDGTLFVNASHCDEGYYPRNKPIRVIL